MKEQIILMVLVGFCVYFYLCVVLFTSLLVWGTDYEKAGFKAIFIVCLFAWPIMLAVNLSERLNKNG